MIFDRSLQTNTDAFIPESEILFANEPRCRCIADGIIDSWVCSKQQQQIGGTRLQRYFEEYRGVVLLFFPCDGVPFLHYIHMTGEAGWCSLLDRGIFTPVTRTTC